MWDLFKSQTQKADAPATLESGNPALAHDYDDTPHIKDHEFERFRRLIYDVAGIALSNAKQSLVAGRLAKRLRHYRLHSYGDYYRLVTDGQHATEFQVMVDLLTTNETYFFREPEHFDFVREQIIKPRANDALRVWSAACSSGEEVYSLAMLLAEHSSNSNWELLGTDINEEVLAKARKGVYPHSRTEQIPPIYRNKYCLKGVRSQQGWVMMDPVLRTHTRFETHNLMASKQKFGRFDVIFLRNVLIYFDQATKKQVVERLLQCLNPGGYFFTSHTESLHQVTDQLITVKPSIFRKP